MNREAKRGGVREGWWGFGCNRHDPSVANPDLMEKTEIPEKCSRQAMASSSANDLLSLLFGGKFENGN